MPQYGIVMAHWANDCPAHDDDDDNANCTPANFLVNPALYRLGRDVRNVVIIMIHGVYYTACIMMIQWPDRLVTSPVALNRS